MLPRKPRLNNRSSCLGFGWQRLLATTDAGSDGYLAIQAATQITDYSNQSVKSGVPPVNKRDALMKTNPIILYTPAVLGPLDVSNS